MAEHLRIDELAEQAAAAVLASGTVPPSARVSAVPDRRMLRYYTTLGLLDRPLEIRGRTAYYGRRHLLQVVAIKRLQGAGASLAEVQRRLLGASTEDLETIARLPEPPAPGAVASGPARPARFWRTAGTSIPAAPGTPEPSAIRIGPGITLVLDTSQPLTERDRSSLREAASGLVDRIATLGLTPTPEEQQP